MPLRVRHFEAFGAVAPGSAGHVRHLRTPCWRPRPQPYGLVLFQPRLHVSLLGRRARPQQSHKISEPLQPKWRGIPRKGRLIFPRVRGRP